MSGIPGFQYMLHRQDLTQTIQDNTEDQEAQKPDIDFLMKVQYEEMHT